MIDVPFEASVDALHLAYARKELRPVDVVRAHLNRVLENDLATSGGTRPPFNAIQTIDPRAVDEALSLERTGERGGALYGIPVWLKDTIDVEGLPTTCGNAGLRESIAKTDARLVKNLREQGAIILGKTCLTELGAGPSGFSSAAGRTGNAYDPRNTPGGSSSGSAVAVSLDFGTLAVGIDDCESITTPAAHNGCVGFRPTSGVVDREGLAAFAVSDTSPGPITRSVADAATMLDALVSSDGTSSRKFRNSVADASIDGIRLGVVESVGRFTMAHEECFVSGGGTSLARSLETMRSAGAKVVDKVRLDGFLFERLSELEYHNTFVEHLRRRACAPRTPFGVYVSSLRFRELILREPDSWWRLVPFKLPNIHERAYRKVVIHNRALVTTLMDRLEIDALVGTTSRLLSTIATLAQLPHLTVPAALVHVEETEFVRPPNWHHGTMRPVGISFLGRPGADEDVLRIGAAFERSRGPRVPPPRALAAASASSDVGEIEAFQVAKRAIGEQTSSLCQFDGEVLTRPTWEEFARIVHGAASLTAP